MRFAALLVGLLALSAGAQEEGKPEEKRVLAGEVIDLALCKAMRDEVRPRIEKFMRMKFRRPVPMNVMPFKAWQDKVKKGDVMGTHALAFYTPKTNEVTVIPWVIGRYRFRNPPKMTAQFWRDALEPTMIHELVHAIHHQNFYSEGRNFAASLKPRLTEEELDRATVDFLLGEGVPELVSIRTANGRSPQERRPQRLDSPAFYFTSYVADSGGPYRMKLFSRGYQDGLNLAYAAQQRTGMRGIRAILYRPPPRHLLFDPDLLATVDLEDPPDPDSVFGFLVPYELQGTGIRLAVNPGKGRFIEKAYQPVGVRAKGCLLGYAAEVANGSYAFFIADPDAPGKWNDEQAKSLRALNEKEARLRVVPLPVDTKAVAHVLEVPDPKGGLWIRAESCGVVILAHEKEPTPQLRTRVVIALRTLHMHRPKKNLYAPAKKKALANYSDE